MRASEFCNTNVIVALRGTSLAEAAALMRAHNVGALVIVDDNGGAPRPLGVLTDRDMAVEVVAGGVAAERLCCGDIMSQPVVTIGRDEDLMEALRRMRGACVRRLAVVDEAGALTGILSVDDVLQQLLNVAAQIPQLLQLQRADEAMRRPGKPA